MHQLFVSVARILGLVDLMKYIFRGAVTINYFLFVYNLLMELPILITKKKTIDQSALRQIAR